jgi:Right handed beta helix region
MRRKRSRAHWAGMLIGALICAVAAPASASASTLWVSQNAPSAPFNSCEHPAYQHVQEAIDAPAQAIHVCGGTYAEQLTIQRAVKITGYEGAKLILPPDTLDSSTPCDTANAEASGTSAQDAISICGAYTVTIKDLDVEAIWPGEPVGPSVSCAYSLAGIQAAGGADLELIDSTVTGAAPKTLNGCQYGVGVLIGLSDGNALGVGTAKLSGDTIDGYQKNGIAVEGTGSEATITKTTVTGAGENPVIAQNGIGVQLGAKGTITKSTISGNECGEAACGANELSSYQSDGVYFYEAAAGSSVSKSTINGNDVGVEAYDATSADPLIQHDTLEGDRWESVSIAEGSATVNNDVMRGGTVGIQLLQYAGQGYGATGTGSHDTIEGMSAWAVLGRSDKVESDLPGEFSITSSKISGNPGAKPQQSVESENPSSLKIYAEKDK